MRFRIECAMAHDFRDVFVKLSNAVWSFVSQLEQATLGVFPTFYERTPAAGVTGKGMNRQRRVRRNQPRVHERAQQQNHGRGITAGVRYALSFGYALALIRD